MSRKQHLSKFLFYLIDCEDFAILWWAFILWKMNKVKLMVLNESRFGNAIRKLRLSSEW